MAPSQPSFQSCLMARRSILYQLYLCLLDELNSGARSLKVHCGHTNHISNTVQFVSGSCTYFSIALVSACRNRGHLNHSLSSSSWEYCKHSWNVLYPHSSWYCRWVPGGTKARTITPRPLSPPQLESLGCQGLPPTLSCYGWTVATNIEHSDALTWQHSAWPRLPHSPGEHVGYRPSSMSPGRFLIPKQYFKNI